MSHQSAYLQLDPVPAPPTLKPATKPHRLRAVSLSRQTDKCTFSIITTHAGFYALEKDWCDLFDRAGVGPQVFQSFHWLWHWCQHFLSGCPDRENFAILTGYRGRRLVMVWPLIVERSSGLRRVTWMGHPVSQYGDALVDHSAVGPRDLAESWNFLTKHISADVVQLRKVRADAAVADVLRSVCSEPHLRQTAPYLDFAPIDTFDNYQKRYSAKARKNRRRLRRRVEERAHLSAKTHINGHARSELATKAISMKRQWLKARGLVSPALQDERTLKFFQAAATSNKHPTGCRTTVLKIGDDPAAIEVSFESKGHCCVHIIVYDAKFEKTGAGVLLLEEGIKSAIADGVQTFDLLAPGDNYKLDWADGAIDVYDWCLPLSKLGRTYHALGFNSLPESLKASLQALPLPVRQILHRGFAQVRQKPLLHA